MKRVCILCLFCIVSTLSCLQIANGDACIPREEKKRFVRIQDNPPPQGRALHTSVITYTSLDGTGTPYTVDLVSALHVGEESYYAALNRAFESYDAVLYELIAPKESAPKRRDKEEGGNLLSFLQRGMKDVLKLEFQLDHIDYSKKNLVHADMSPEEFVNSMQERGESIFSMIITLLLRSSELEKKNPNMAPEVVLMKMLLDPNGKVSLRGLLAYQFEDVELLSEILDGPGGSTILGARNDVALKVLKSEIAKGKKRLAIFYGAGHMPDLEKHLIEDFNMKCEKHTWVQAWKL